MAVSTSDFIGTRAVAQASAARDMATVFKSLSDLHDEVRANHEETKAALASVHDETERSIVTLEQSWHEARDKRDGQMARVGDKIEQLQQDVSRIGAQVQFLIKNPQQ